MPGWTVRALYLSAVASLAACGAGQEANAQFKRGPGGPGGPGGMGPPMMPQMRGGMGGGQGQGPMMGGPGQGGQMGGGQGKMGGGGGMMQGQPGPGGPGGQGGQGRQAQPNPLAVAQNLQGRLEAMLGALEGVMGDERLGKTAGRRLQAAVKSATVKQEKLADQLSGLEERERLGVQTARDQQRLTTLIGQQQALLQTLEPYRQNAGELLAKKAK